MPDLSARLDLPLIKPSQAQKHVTHNEALQILDGLVQAVLEETGAETPPSEPAPGTVYALGGSPADDWDGQAGKLALRAGEAWLFIDPQEGWRAWDKAAGAHKVFDGADWAHIRPGLDNLDGLGIGTASDTVNRLAVASEASLFTHDGAGHQVKVNKAAAGDTASLLFQSDWTGHAEMGLSGDTAFSIKVSDDGASWYEAIRADAAAQEVEIGFHLTGDAVQQNATDTTAGRLMRADYGFAPGNLLGTVSQSGGTPTGAVIERGSNANGEYVRFADGTQICFGLVQPDFATSGVETFDLPADFAGDKFGGVTGMNAGSTTAAANYESVRSSGGGSTTQFFVRLDGTGTNGAGIAYQLQFLFVGRWF